MSAEAKVDVMRRNDIDPAEWQTRVDLAAAYRLADMMGWNDLLGTHITCRVPGAADQFLINPYGMLFEEVTASSLIKVDVDGNKLSDSPFNVSKAGFIIHSAIHMANSDAQAVMHCHSPYGVAISAQKAGLQPIMQQVLVCLAQLRYHDYEGLSFDLAERERLLRDLGTGTMLILRNHGTLTVGQTIPEMYYRMHLLERACRFQFYAQSAGGEIQSLPADVVAHAIEQGRKVYSRSALGSGEIAWAALKRKLERAGADYAV